MMVLMKMDVGWGPIAHLNVSLIVLQSLLFSATTMKSNVEENTENTENTENLMQVDVRYQSSAFHGLTELEMMDRTAGIAVLFFATPIKVKLTANGRVGMAVRGEDTVNRPILQAWMARHAPDFVQILARGKAKQDRGKYIATRDMMTMAAGWDSIVV